MPTLERLDATTLTAVIRTFRDVVRSHQQRLNRLNVYPVPDGDTGTNMARTLDAVVAELDGVPRGPDGEPTLDATCAAISHGSLMGARGNSGVILSQVLRGFATTVKGEGPISADTFAAALEAASAGAYQAVLTPIEGTILTVARESAAAARRSADDGDDLLDVATHARAAAQTALDATPELLPVLAEAGVVDAGGAGYLLFLDAVLHVVGGVDLPAPPDGEPGVTPVREERRSTGSPVKVGGAGDLDVSEQRYEVMFFLDLLDARIDDFKAGWGAIGDSIVVVGGDGLWNCHVHTNDVGAAIETALDLDGRPRQIRVTDLFEEVGEEHATREAAMTSPGAGAGLPPVGTAIVAVGTGDGLLELFAQLGVQGVVAGGQTMNPSTAELLDVVEHVNAPEVVILPNNKNIIPVALQVDDLSTKTVRVVPTTSVPEGLAALIVYDPETTSAANLADMTVAAASVRTGSVTQSIRDTNSDAGPIAVGEWIGIVRGDGIVSVSGSVDTTATALLDHLLGDGAELLTIITGADATPDVTASVLGWMRDHHCDVAVEVHDGGQPLYPYLFGVE